jgi:hypothetical protein
MEPKPEPPAESKQELTTVPATSLQVQVLPPVLTIRELAQLLRVKTALATAWASSQNLLIDIGGQRRVFAEAVIERLRGVAPRAGLPAQPHRLRRVTL